jgi:hypothetical protein
MSPSAECMERMNDLFLLLYYYYDQPRMKYLSHAIGRLNPLIVGSITCLFHHVFANPRKNIAINSTYRHKSKPKHKTSQYFSSRGRIETIRRYRKNRPLALIGDRLPSDLIHHRFSHAATAPDLNPASVHFQ